MREAPLSLFDNVPRVMTAGTSSPKKTLSRKTALQSTHPASSEGQELADDSDRFCCVFTLFSLYIEQTLNIVKDWSTQYAKR